MVISNLCPPDYDGGFELSAYRNALSLRARGHDVTFVTGNFRTSFQGERVDPPWVHRIFKTSEVRDGWSDAEMFIGGQSNLHFSIRDIFRQIHFRLANLRALSKMLDVAPGNEAKLDQFLAENEFDVAYVFGLHKIGTSVIRSLMKKGIPAVYHQGDEWLAYYVHPGLLKRALLNLASPVTYFRERKIDLHHVVLVSEFMKRRFADAGIRESRLEVIYRGIELPISEPDRERYFPPVFFIASRLTLYKGIHFAIKAAKLLRDRNPTAEWEMWIAGQGESQTMQYFYSLVEQYQLHDRVRFVGKLTRESAYDHMKRATAVISPSVFDEPFGNTNIEAMASGTPLIASRSGAIEEIIDHGKSGLIYDRAKPEELAHHMQLILANPNLRYSLAVEGVNRVREKFMQEDIMDQVEAKLADVSGMPLGTEVREPTRASLQ